MTEGRSGPRCRRNSSADSQIAEPDAAARIAQPIEEIDVARPSLFQNDTIGSFFDRLRAEEPVHYCRESYVGPTGPLPSSTTSWRWTPIIRSSSEAKLAELQSGHAFGGRRART